MKKKIVIQKILLSIFIGLPMLGYAQADGVGIGTDEVDEHAILEIKSADKGVLIPNVANPNKVSSAPTESMLIYNDRDHRFSYFGKYSGSVNRWMDLNPWLTSDVKSGGAVYATIPYKIGVNMSREPNAELEVNGKIKATEFVGLGTVPEGGIIMWNGNASTIPDGYALCDGAGGRPDLRGKFILGGTAGGATGGLNTSTTTTMNYKKLAKYTTSKPNCESNKYNYYYKITGTFGGHAREETRYGGNCTEHVDFFVNVKGWDYANCEYVSEPNPNYYERSACITDGYTELSVVGSTDNRPAYYVLAFIMRVD